MRFMTPIVIGLIALATAATSHADPVQITRGAIVLDFEGHFFFLGGPNVDVSSRMPSEALDPYIPLDFHGRCFPCRVGEDIVDLGFTTPGEVFVGSGAATFAGQSYAELFYRAQWTVDAVGEVFPAPTTGPAVRLSQPFTLTGSLRGFLDPGFTTPAFATALRGQGRARTHYHYDLDTDAYFPEEGQTVYEFEDAAPVPEPATVGMVACGLAALAARRRRRA